MIALARLRFRAALASPRAIRFALDLTLGVLLFSASHALYRSSTGTVQLCDSTYSMVVCEKFLNEGTLDLAGCMPADARARAALPGRRSGTELPYHLVRSPNDASRIHYGYPLGSSVLSLPFVEYYRCRGLTMLSPNGVPNYTLEGAVQTRIAARVCAALVVLIYAIARFYCSPLVAGLLAAGFACGSPVWSTLSRSLWSHTWMAFWLSGAILVLVAARRCVGRSWKADAAFGLGLGTALFWATFCRQHAVVSAIAIGAYLLVHERRLLGFTILVGGTWSAALVAASFAYFGTAMPPSVYAAGMIDGHDMLNRAAWLMVSPARGLFVYCPYLLVVGTLLVVYRRHITDAGLLMPAGLAIAGQTAMLASYNGWHANWAYGPRYYCDVLPWFVLLTAMSVNALVEKTRSSGSWRTAIWAIPLALAFAWGLFVHARGANSTAAWMWNDRTHALGDEGAVKDWRHPQFLTGIAFDVLNDGSVQERRWP